MKPTTFKGQNIVYAKDQPEYLPLPALKFDTDRGEVVCCWKMSLFERIRAFVTGRMWIIMITHNRPLQPHYMSTDRLDVFMTESDIKRREKRFYRKWSGIFTGKKVIRQANQIFNQN
jgi:hypothetical protein